MLTSLVRHLHDFIEDVELNEREWAAATDFRTATGQECDDVRQEFVLLFGVLGVSMLVETVNQRAAEHATQSAVLGPAQTVASRASELGADMALDGKGEPCLVTGEVTGLDGEPLAGAQVDVWQADEDGFYDVEQPGVQPDRNLRGPLTADDAGRLWFRSVVPRYCPIPVDRPVGPLIEATGRHPCRPAHVHFIVSAPGQLPVTTHLFVVASPCLDSDAVVTVKPSPVRSSRLVDDPARVPEAGGPNSFRSVHLDVGLLGADAA